HVLVGVEVLCPAPVERPALRQTALLPHIDEPSSLRHAVVAPQGRPEWSDQKEIEVAVVVEIDRLEIGRWRGELRKRTLPWGESLVARHEEENAGVGDRPQIEVSVLIEVKGPHEGDRAAEDHA